MRYFVNTPSETASNFVRFAQETAAYPGITFGCSLDNHIIPLRPGRALGLLARPGHGKTSLLGYLALREANAILERGAEKERYAVLVSWEQSVEELEAMYQEKSDYGVTDVAWGRVPIEQVIRNSKTRPTLPVWLFGESLYKSHLDSPTMTVEGVYNAIRAIWKERGMLPSILCFDYIQDIPVPEETDRYMQVSSAMRKVKRLAIQTQCPLVLGIQASQRVDTYNVPIPQLNDSEWSAVIGQKVDVLLALWRPIRSVLPHEQDTIDVAGTPYKNTDNLMVVRLLKQRFEKGFGTWAFKFDTNRLALSDFGSWPRRE